MSEKLKPCPFCGGEATCHTQANFRASTFAIRCKSCGCFSALYDDFPQAIAAWNARTPNTSVKADVESVAKAIWGAAL